MPIKVPNNLPAAQILMKEQIFIMPEERAIHQDIRELRIAILNLMPLKQQTEVQLLKLIANSPLQVEVTLLAISSYEAKNTSKEYLLTFYKTFDEVKDQKLDEDPRHVNPPHLLGGPGRPVLSLWYPQKTAAGKDVWSLSPQKNS